MLVLTSALDAVRNPPPNLIVLCGSAPTQPTDQLRGADLQQHSPGRDVVHLSVCLHHQSAAATGERTQHTKRLSRAAAPTLSPDDEPIPKLDATNGIRLSENSDSADREPIRAESNLAERGHRLRPLGRRIRRQPTLRNQRIRQRPLRMPHPGIATRSIDDLLCHRWWDRAKLQSRRQHALDLSIPRESGPRP